MRCKWRSKSEGEDAGTVPGRTRAVKKKKSEVKRRVWNKIDAPRSKKARLK